MSEPSLQEALDDAESPESFVRSISPHADSGHLRLFADVRPEFTNWREEQRAWKETAGLADLSHHMYDLRVEGPDASNLLADVGAISLSASEPGKAKQFIACNPDGYLIGDGILFHLEPEVFNLVGYSAINWVRYHGESGGYDVSMAVNEHGGAREGPPWDFRYQIQGPDALDVIRDALDGPLPEIPFFNFAPVSVAGHEIYALRHGMMDEPGFELFGPWEHQEEVLAAFLEAGEAYGMRRIGSKAYPTNTIPNAWVPLPVPAIYSDGMEDYRAWLDAGSWEGAYTVGGSFEPEDVSEYYLTPVDVGLGRFLDLDREFIGRDALADAVSAPRREKVTLVWDVEDTRELVNSYIGGEETYRYLDLPMPIWATAMYDEVRNDGELAGVAVAPRYLFWERRMFSLGSIDTALAEPGTELTLVWGETGESSNPRVEPHEQFEVTVEVGPVPYYEDKRKTAPEYAAD